MHYQNEPLINLTFSQIIYIYIEYYRHYQDSI